MASKGRSKASNRKAGNLRDPRPRFSRYDPNAIPIWEIAEALAAKVPDSEWRKVPPDLARNLHRYLHGGPKEDGQ